MPQKKRQEVTREDLAELVEEELGRQPEEIHMSRRKFLKRFLQGTTLGAVALSTLGYGYAAYRLSDFLLTNPKAARMVENVALEANLVKDYCGLGEEGVRARKIMLRNESLKDEYRKAISEAKSAQLEMQNAQLRRAARQAEQLFTEFQQIHSQYAEQFEKDQGDLGLLARRSKAIAIDTAVNLDAMLAEIRSGTSAKLVGMQRKIYKMFGDALGVPQLSYDQRKIDAFKRKYHSLVNTIKEIQTNKKQVEAVDDRFAQKGGNAGYRYAPWVEYCKRRVQLEKTYLGLRRVEDGMHAVPDWTVSDKDVERYSKQVEHWRKRKAELDTEINNNVEMVRKYTGKEISSDNMFDDFKNKVTRYLFYAAAGAAVVTAGSFGYCYKRAADFAGLDKHKIQAKEYKDLAERQAKQDMSRRDVLGKVFGFLKRGDS